MHTSGANVGKCVCEGDNDSGCTPRVQASVNVCVRAIMTVDAHLGCKHR